MSPTYSEPARQQPSTGSLLGRFLLGELAGQPRVVNIEVTTRCNAQCAFCDHRDGRREGELQDFHPVVEHFRPLAVNLTGGEPLLRRDLPQIVRQVRRAGPGFVSLLTNGALLTVPRAEELRAAGLDGLSISLNHIGAQHDRERGVPGLYRHLADLVPRLTRLGFRRVDLNTVVMDSNLHEILGLAALARAWGAGLGLSCYSTTKNGHRDGHVVDPRRHDELVRLVNTLQRLRAAGWPIQSSDWYLARVPRFHAEGGIPGCLAGRRTVHVTPDGLVKPCPDLAPTGHYASYRASRAPRVRCSRCWYRCRGEVEAPLTPSQILFYLRHLQPGRPR